VKSYYRLPREVVKVVRAIAIARIAVLADLDAYSVERVEEVKRLAPHAFDCDLELAAKLMVLPDDLGDWGQHGIEDVGADLLYELVAPFTEDVSKLRVGGQPSEVVVGQMLLERRPVSLGKNPTLVGLGFDRGPPNRRPRSRRSAVAP
jgi:hypothetical protein